MSNLKDVDFQVPRTSEARLISSIIDLANGVDGGCSHVQFAFVDGSSPMKISRDQLESDALLSEIKDDDSHAVDNIDLISKAVRKLRFALAELTSQTI